MKKLNKFFFGYEKVRVSEQVCFYGALAFMIVTLIFIVIPARIQLGW